MDTFDDYQSLFRTLGLSEAQARAGAIGRSRSESEARAEFADAAAADLAEDLLDRRARGAQILAEHAPVTEGVNLAGLPLPVSEVAMAARDGLGMSEADARSMAVRLHARETRRAGAEHADRFSATLAMGLRRPVREVAPR